MNCPRCEYDLTGLPAEHACPECGLTYDPHSIGIHLRGYRWRYAAMAQAVVLLGVLSWSMRGEPYAGITLTVLGIAVVWNIIANTRGVGRIRSLLVINREGVCFEHADGRRQVISWSTFGRAECGWAFGYFSVTAIDGSRIMNVHYGELGSLRIAKRCAREMNRLSNVYTAGAVRESASSR